MLYTNISIKVDGFIPGASFHGAANRRHGEVNEAVGGPAPRESRLIRETVSATKATNASRCVPSVIPSVSCTKNLNELCSSCPGHFM